LNSKNCLGSKKIFSREKGEPEGGHYKNSQVENQYAFLGLDLSLGNVKMQQCTVTVQEKYVLFLDIVIIGLNKCFCFGIFLSDKMETKILKKAAYNVLDLW
jgi:hypothetical protein